MITLDPWQQEVLDDILINKRNICLRSGRQCGKTEIIALAAARYALENPNKVVMVVASVERQSQLLFQRILGYIIDLDKKQLKGGKDKPTLHKLMLKNGSVIWSLPCGMDGSGIRGWTISLLIVDEAAYVPNAVFVALTPSLLTQNSQIILLSTPKNKEGYYFDSFNDPNYKSYHISSLDCPRANKEFLERERLRLTKAQFACEYMGEFADELMQYFPSELIRKVMIARRQSPEDAFTFGQILPAGETYCGVDIASMGEDESVISSFEKKGDKLIQIDMEITKKTFLEDTFNRIKKNDSKYNYSRIYLDDGGLGVSVMQSCLRDDQLKRKTEALNNSRRSLDKDDKQKKKLMKEDFYSNLLWLMQNEKIELLDEPEIFLSLSSVQYEPDPETRSVKIFGRYTHCAESIIRGAWAMQTKHLNLWVA
jgi:hypothetical protein